MLTRAALRAYFFFLCLVALTILFSLWHGDFLSQPLALSLYVALGLLSFSLLVTESYFTKPNDVISNSTQLLILIVPLAPVIIAYSIGYYLIIGAATLALVAAVASNMLFDPTSPSRASQYLKVFATRLGSGRVLFGAACALLLLNERTGSSPYFIAALVFALLFLTFDLARFADQLHFVSRQKRPGGRIIGVQGDDLVIAAAPTGKPTVGRRAIVRIGDECFTARVVSHHRLHDEGRTTFVITGGTSPSKDEMPTKGEYIWLDEDVGEHDAIVGLVNARTTVPTLKFRQSPDTALEVGNIVSCQVRDASVYYQVQEGCLVQEKEPGADATDIVEVSAAQIGRWNSDAASFERHGWLPNIYTDVVTPKTFPEPVRQPGEVQIGTIPGTSVPVFLNAEEAVTHHTAVLGVTGVGKSVFVRDLIRNLAGESTKFICVDLTREYLEKFGNSAGLLVSQEKNAFLSRKVNDLGKELSKFRNQQDENVLNGLRKEIVDEFRASILTFLGDISMEVLRI